MRSTPSSARSSRARSPRAGDAEPRPRGREAILSAEARTDLREAISWISQDSPQAAEALRRAVRRAARLLGEHPEIGRQGPELTPETVRFLVLRGFPYVVVYRASATPPRILRVLHGARDLPEVLQDFERE